MIPYFNLAETGSFFKDILGIASVMDTPDYAIFLKDNLTIYILPAGKIIGQTGFCPEADCLNGWWNIMKDKVKGLKVRGSFDRYYGMREAPIEVPQTNTLIFIGQSIEPLNGQLFSFLNQPSFCCRWLQELCH